MTLEELGYNEEYKIEAVKNIINEMSFKGMRINVENLPNEVFIRSKHSYNFGDFSYDLFYENIDDFINNIERDLNQANNYFKTDYVNELFQYQATEGNLDLNNASTIVRELNALDYDFNRLCEQFEDFTSRCNGPELEYNPETVEVGLEFGTETLDTYGYVCMEASLFYNDWAGEEHIVDFNIRYDLDENHYDCIIENEEEDNDLFESMIDNDILPYKIDINIINNKAEILNNLKSSSLEDKLSAAEEKAASQNKNIDTMINNKDDISL